MSVFFESLIFGAAQSLHCAGMCGPLAAATHGQVGYQLARIGSYTAVGALAGTLPFAPNGAWVPGVLGAALILHACFGERVLAVPGLARCARPVLARAMRLPTAVRGAALGLLTPLLPCGLLYAAVAAAAVSGSAAAGMLTMLGFALGTAPLVAIAQWLLPAFGPVARRLVTGAAGAILVGRAILASGGGSCCS